MASPPVRVPSTSAARGDRLHRRRVGLVTDVVVLCMVAAFVVGAFVVGLVILHSSLTGR